MWRIRAFEERVGALTRSNDVPGLVHLSVGSEGVAVGVCGQLRDDDAVYSNHRAHGHALGSALAARQLGTAAVAVVFFGDGAVQGGIFAESVNLATLWRLPVLLVTLALDQLVNAAAKAHFMSGGQLTVPLVLRTQGGAGQRGGAQHSQSLEAWLTHVPGLKVAMPSTAADVAGLLASAIADPNPVVVVENKTLYFRREESSPPAPVPLGRARVVRAGRDVTVVALSRLVHEALAAAEELATEGIEVEVLDPRTLVPLDLETIAGSVRRTNRLVVAHEAVAHGGFGAAIAAQVQAACFDDLDGPVERVGAPFTPIPFSPPLEDAYLPGRDEVAAAVRRTLGRPA